MLGMKSAFGMPKGSANFERIAPRKPDDYLAISEAFHKTFIAVDEKGVSQKPYNFRSADGNSIPPPPSRRLM